MKDQFPWTEGGKDLLLAFKLLINQYGGREKLINSIESETIKYIPNGKTMFGKRAANRFSKRDELTIAKLYPTHTARSIAKKLNRTEEAIYSKIKIMTRHGLIKPNSKIYKRDSFLLNKVA